MCDYTEGVLGLENNGIPIPRNHGTQFLIHSMLSSQHLSDPSGSFYRTPLVPPNSLASHLSNADNSRNISPYFFHDSPTPGVNNPGNVDMELEIKMEPCDDFNDIGMTNSCETKYSEDNLLDNVNFEDLLMPDEVDSSTTCLDPQHSSPAAMATVHPDEVLGMIRGSAFSTHRNHPHNVDFNSSVPVKVENDFFDRQPILSFPPQSMIWKDSPTAPTSGFSLAERPSIDFFKLSSVDPHGMQEKGIGIEHTRQDNVNFTPEETQPQYTQLEPAKSVTHSALHNLLSSGLRHSSRTSHGSQISPGGSSISPISPRPDFNGQEIHLGESVPGNFNFLARTGVSSRLSSSAPSNNIGFDHIWQHREPRPHLISTGSLAEEAGGSTSSLSTGGGILSPLSYDFSVDDGAYSDSDLERFDSESDSGSFSEDINLSTSGKKERYFWQYNVQAKGPKGHKVYITPDQPNPYNLGRLQDPVFSTLCSVQGIKHSGKARRGDGNDLTPNPKKLVTIGIELKKLDNKIKDMTPVSELPTTVRSKSRKEKNKLASRACRLKKKANHEANKIKLYGLEQEHKGILSLRARVAENLVHKLDLIKLANSEQGETSNEESERAHMQRILTLHIDNTTKLRTKCRVAGYTTDCVNQVVKKCQNGELNGGLPELAEIFSNLLPTPNSPGSHDLHISMENQLFT